MAPIFQNGGLNRKNSVNKHLGVFFYVVFFGKKNFFLIKSFFGKKIRKFLFKMAPIFQNGRHNLSNCRFDVRMCSVLNLEIVYPINFFDGFVLPRGPRTNSAWL